MNEHRPSPVRWMKVGFALLLLHVALSAAYPWENEPVYGVLRGSFLRMSLDALILLVIGHVVVLRWGYRSLFAHASVLCVFFALAYRFGETAIPTFYGHPFDPFFDVDYLGGLKYILTREFTRMELLLRGAIVTAAAAALYWVLFWSGRTWLRAATNRRWSYAVLGMLQVVVLAFWVQGWVRPEKPRGVFSKGMFYEATAWAAETVVTKKWDVKRRFDLKVAAAERRLAGVPRDLRRLGGADVFVLFVESYGRDFYRKPEHFADYRTWAAKFTETLRARGFDGRTGFGYPSIRGGNSSLAHAELLSGIAVSNRRHFDLLLKSRLESMPGIFVDAGYRTINVQPAMPVPWPEAKFFGFEHDVFGPQLPYQGMRYPWGDMPDQFALDHLLRTEVKTGETRKPLFVQYVSVTSHGPFSLIPPYYEDWSRVATDSFPPAESFPIRWDNYAGHPNLEEAYKSSIRYSLETMFGFCLQLERPSVVIILGDHQPPVPSLVTDLEDRDVPIHILTNRPALLAGLPPSSFAPGLVPPENLSGWSFTLFLARFLTLFSDGETAVKPAGAGAKR